MPEPGDEFGRYRIESRLGQGGMGVVYLAHDLTLDRRIALKVVAGVLAGDPGFRERFQREATTLARLDSPHIITIYDHGEYDGLPFIATQYVAGGDLGKLLRARGALPPALAARICAQIVGALADAHRAGVVHREVKPANVLLRDPDAAEPTAYLCDFGIAQTDSEGLTGTGMVAGTWAYLAPERAAGASASAASDLYAVGCLLWALLTGRPPYGGSDVEMAIAHRDAPIPRLPGRDPLSRRLNTIIGRAMAKDPGARYATAEAFRADLLAVAGSGDGATRLTALPSEAATPRARALSPKLLAGLVVLLLAVVVGGGAAAYQLTRPDDSDPSSDRGSNQASDSAGSEASDGGLSDDERAAVTARAFQNLELALTLSSAGYDRQVEAATEVMTDSFAAEYRRTSTNAKKAYVDQKVTTTAIPIEVGITSGTEDRAEVLAVVEQTTEKVTGEPVSTTRSQVWASMVPAQDDNWLIDDLQVSNAYTGAPEPDAERQAAMDVASDFIDLFVELDYRSLDEREAKLSKLQSDDIEGVVLDPDQRSKLEASKVVVAGDPLQAGVIEFQGGQAKVLVTWRGAHTDTGASERDVAEQFRLTLHLTDGEWRVFQLESEL